MAHKGQPEYVRIAISRPDGGVSIMQFITFVRRHADDPGQVRDATPENIEAEIKKSGTPCTRWHIIDDADIPADRAFRAAWTDAGGKIDHDMEKARAIHMGRIRTARNAKLDETDKLVARLDGAPVPEELKALRQKLRDIPQTLDLAKAATVEDLKAAWPDELK